MKMFRKLVSIVAAATVLTSSLAFTFAAGAAEVGSEADAVVASEPNLQTNPQNGVILHAFNWSYNTIKDNLPAIKAAGYSDCVVMLLTNSDDLDGVECGLK